MAHKIKIECYSHGARLSGYSRETLQIINNFLEQYMLKDMVRQPNGRMVEVVQKQYFGQFLNKEETYVHVRTVPEIVSALEYHGVAIEMVMKEPPTPVPAKFEVKPHFIPLDYQVPIIAELGDTRVSVRLDLQTGKGKTFCTLQTLCNMGVRSCAMIPPKYFGIWEKALDDIYVGIAGRYRMVSGSAQLKKLMLEALAGSLDTDFICIANTTYRNYINEYEEAGSHSSYPVSPLQFHEICGIGAQVNDEFQEDPGLVFRIDIFTNVAKQIYLSATPYTGNAFVTRMINYALPPSTLCTLPEWSKYIDCIGLIYNESSIRPKDYLTPFKNTYNHARYETKLLENKKRLPVYFDMVKRLVNVLFVKEFQKGQRCLILCATVEFIKHLTAFLKKEFPQFVVNAHVQGSDFAQLEVNDITISTIKSSGTGVDIRNLKECILLQATGSEKDNVQIMGRLRVIKDFPNISPRFTYLACRHIPQHMRYLNDKQDIFEGKAKSHKLLNF